MFPVTPLFGASSHPSCGRACAACLDVINPVANQRSTGRGSSSPRSPRHRRRDCGVAPGTYLDVATSSPGCSRRQEAQGAVDEKDGEDAVRNTRATLVAVAASSVLMAWRAAIPRAPRRIRKSSSARDQTSMSARTVRHAMVPRERRRSRHSARIRCSSRLLTTPSFAASPQLEYRAPDARLATSAGGMLTDKQIDAIVAGIRSWAKPGHVSDRVLLPCR